LESRKINYHKIKFKDLILFEDDTLLVINKPQGITSLAERNKPESGLLRLGRQYYPGLRLCHRLDKMTTGVLVFAKTDDAFRHVAIQFQKRKVKKHYKAVVLGIHHFEDKNIQLPFKITTKGFRVDKEGKKAWTIFNTEETFRYCSLLDCQPITGRTHQIRVHLSLLKAPIIGDLEYNGPDLYLSDLKKHYKVREPEEEQPLNHFYLLHAQKLSLEHPATSAFVTFEAPYSKNFEVVLKMLRKYK